jgi:hypothetical protein
VMLGHGRMRGQTLLWGAVPAAGGGFRVLQVRVHGRRE